TNLPLREPLNGRVITHQQRSPRCSAVCPPRLPEAGAWESSFAISTPLSAPEGDQIPEARRGIVLRRQPRRRRGDVVRVVVRTTGRTALAGSAAWGRGQGEIDGRFDVQAGGGEDRNGAVRSGDHQLDLGTSKDNAFGAGLCQ